LYVFFQKTLKKIKKKQIFFKKKLIFLKKKTTFFPKKNKNESKSLDFFSAGFIGVPCNASLAL
jgi:hypothetical protein